MKLQQIITRRSFETWPSWNLVYEWEDCLIQSIDELSLYNDKKIRTNHYLSKIPLWSSILQTRKNSFVFDMWTGAVGENLPNIVPCIIDFYLRDDAQINDFVRQHNRQKIVFVSSREVYDFLVQKHTPLNIHHLPLSISDKYRITAETVFEKKYDLLLMGRQNERMNKWIQQYMAENPDLYVVYRKQEGGVFNYYSNRGEYLGDINTREKYMSLMRQSRIALYATPGIEGDGKNTHGFHQVTPRFLECIASGAHVIACYEENSDTQYFELGKICPNTVNYEHFRQQMDACRNTSVDMRKYSAYLSSHYTSCLAEQLKEKLKDL